MQTLLNGEQSDYLASLIYLNKVDLNRSAWNKADSVISK